MLLEFYKIYEKNEKRLLKPNLSLPSSPLICIYYKRNAEKEPQEAQKT
jgi:hypothetical protein